MTRMPLALAVILALAASSAAAQQPRPRDFVIGRPSAGSGIITGRVTASDTGVPLRQAIVAASVSPSISSHRAKASKAGS